MSTDKLSMSSDNSDQDGELVTVEIDPHVIEGDSGAWQILTPGGMDQAFFVRLLDSG